MKPTMLNSEALAVVLLPVAAGLVVFYILAYTREARQARQIRTSQKALLSALRLTAACMVVLALVRPAISTVRHETRLPVVPILVDDSSSMTYPDAPENAAISGNSRAPRFELAAQLAQQLQDKLSLSHRVKVYSFSDSLKLLKDVPQRRSDSTPALTRNELFGADARPAGEYSNIGDAIDSALSEHSGDRISGMILLSDGRQTGGMKLSDAAEKAAKIGVPVHAVAAGNEFPLVDFSIDEVIVDNEVSLNDVLIIQLKVTNNVKEGLDAEMTLQDKAGKPAAKKFKLKRGKSTIAMHTIPESVGLHEYHIQFPKFPDEVNVDNNAADFSVNVIKRDMRTLLIAGAPNREYFYLVPALLRHPTINLSCWLQSASPLYTQQGHTTLSQLPKTTEEWKAYDVIILYDPNPNKLEASQIAAIAETVKSGAGLLIIGGTNFSLASMVQVHPTIFRELLPVEVDKSQLPNLDKHYDKPFSVERTEQGKTHETLLASGDSKRNDQIWSGFPQLFWSHPVVSVKSNATELLRRSDIKGRAGCLMAVMRYDNGKVFYSGINGFWRWRFPTDGYDFDNFWLRVLRYLGSRGESGKQTNQVALSTDKSTYSPGEDVQITMKLLDLSLKPQLAGQKIYAAVQGRRDAGGTTQSANEKEAPEMAALDPLDAAGTLFQGVYRPRQSGSMSVQVQVYPLNAGTSAQPIIETPRLPFQVKIEALEARDTSADLEAMRALAEKTSGKYFDYHNMNEINALADSISKDPQVLSEPVVLEIWDSWLFALIFIGFISAEWCLRKQWGLL